ncbi:MAG: VCBS repeat-containing protein, partial [Candidatus Tectomicrobia bacterium]|nr:VCBS repeat-containing protein [Candidatus Tectomicrobia bacterium]
HHVVLTWEGRPDLVENGTGGYLSRLSRRLQWINVSTDGVNSGQPFQSYEFGYIPSPNSSQSLLDSIRRSGVDLDTGVPVNLPPVSLTYRGESPAPTPFKFFDGDAYSWKGLAVSDWAGICDREQLWCQNTATGETRRRTIDMDGDGLVDYVDTKDWNSQTKQWQVYRNNGQGFKTPILWSAPAEFIQTINKNTGVTNQDTFDLNGDGKPDYVVCDGSLPSWQVYWNRGNGFDSTPTPWTSTQSRCRSYNPTNQNTYLDTLDINGDGKPDHVYTQGWSDTNQKWKVYLNQYPAQNGFDSDGIDFLVERQDGGSEDLSIIRIGAGASLNTFDINSDGLPDLVRAPGAGIGKWWIYLNEGTRIRYRATWSPPLNAIRFQDPNGSYTWDTLDINGDGLVDLVDGTNWSEDNTYWEVYLGTGNMDQGFLFTAQKWKALLPFTPFVRQTSGRGYDVFDIDGDGLVDFVDGIREPQGGVHWDVRFNQGADRPQWVLWSERSPAPMRPDLLVGMENGLGGGTALTYGTSTLVDSSGGGIPALPFPVWLVGTLSQDNGLGLFGLTRFSYQGGLFEASDPLGLEFRGFRWMSEEDPLGNITTTEFHQDFLWKGKPKSQRVYNAAGSPPKDVIKDVIWEWAGRCFNNDPLLSGFTSAVCASYGLTGRGHIHLGKRTELLYKDAIQYDWSLSAQDGFDGYGNLIASHTEGATAGIKVAPVYTTITYASLAESGAPLNTYIVARPETITVSETIPVSDGRILEKKKLGYDVRGNQTRVILDPDTGGIQATTVLQYHPSFGYLTQETNARGYPTTYTYDTTYQTYPVTIVNALNQTMTQAFDARWGKLTSSKDPNQAEWQWSYDAFGRLRKEALPEETLNNPQKTLEYFTYTPGTSPVPNRVGAKLKEPNAASGYREQWSFFDGFGRLLQQKHQAYVNGTKTDIAGQTLRYNARGEVEKSLAPFVAAGLDTYSPNHPTEAGTTFTYDALGRLLRQTNPDNTSRSTSYPGFLTTLI